MSLSACLRDEVMPVNSTRPIENLTTVCYFGLSMICFNGPPALNWISVLPRPLLFIFRKLDCAAKGWYCCSAAIGMMLSHVLI